MAIEYQHALNTGAYNRLVRPQAIPDFKLMVGSAEALHSLPITMYKDFYGKQAKALIEPIKDLPAEKVDPQLVGKTYEPNDFIYNDFWLGNPIDGV